MISHKEGILTVDKHSREWLRMMIKDHFDRHIDKKKCSPIWKLATSLHVITDLMNRYGKVDIDISTRAYRVVLPNDMAEFF